MVMYMSLMLRLITENKKGGAYRPNPVESLRYPPACRFIYFFFIWFFAPQK